MPKDKTESGSKVTKKPSKSAGAVQTSLCIPSSIISKSNARNLEQITYVAYQVAKAATIYNVSEIVVLDVPSVEERENKAEVDSQKAVKLAGEKGNVKIKFNISNEDIIRETSSDSTTATEELKENPENENNSLLFATLLQFFVTPPYLVKGVFAASKFNKKFKFAEKLPKLSTLPFMTNNNVISDFKEGLTIPKHTPKIIKKSKKVSALKKLKVTRYVNTGGATPLELNGQEVPVNVRVTVDIQNKKIVSPQTAYGVSGSKASFGYFVRFAKNFSSIFTELSFPGGYTESVFINADNYFNPTGNATLPQAEKATGGQILFVVGNLHDLEYSFAQDAIPGVGKATEMFDSEITVPAGLRIEDAALVGLTKAL